MRIVSHIFKAFILINLYVYKNICLMWELSKQRNHLTNFFRDNQQKANLKFCTWTQYDFLVNRPRILAVNKRSSIWDCLNRCTNICYSCILQKICKNLCSTLRHTFCHINFTLCYFENHSWHFNPQRPREKTRWDNEVYF